MAHKSILPFGEWFKVYEQAGRNFKKSQSIFESMVLEQKSSKGASELVLEAKENDSEEVKSHPSYEDVMNWFDRPGPVKGRMTMDKEKVQTSMQYWTGDLSSKLGNQPGLIDKCLSLLSDPKKVKNLKKQMAKASQSSRSLKWDTEKITSAATQLKEEFEKLHSSGKKIDGKDEESGLNYALNTSKPGDPKATRYLGILPLYLKEDYYKGKDLSKSKENQMNAWYMKLEKEGVDSFISILNDSKYQSTKVVDLTDEFKIKILDKVQERSEKAKKKIEDALKLYITPEKATETKTPSKITTAGEPTVTTETGSFAFPYAKGNEQMAMTYFKDDLAELRDDMAGQMVQAINDFVKSIRDQGSEITKFSYKIIASTSNVPSQYGGGGKLTGSWSPDNNKILVQDRAKVLEQEIKQAISENGLDAISTAAAPVLTPNNTLGGKADWSKLRDKYKLKVNPDGTRTRVDSSGNDTTSEYEALFGPARHSGAMFEIEYTKSTVTPTEDEIETLEVTTVGDWRVYISWSKPPKRGGRDIGKNIGNKRIGFRIGGFFDSGGGGHSVGDLCAAYGG